MTVAADLVIAVDGGGSKTDVVLLDLSGRMLGWQRGSGSSPQVEGLTNSVRVIDGLIDQVLEGRDPRRLAQVGVYLSGLDLDEEIQAFRAAIAHLPWAAGPTVAENDLHALLRAGTDSRNAVAVICGTGMNAIGVREDGTDVRFLALGPLSGDWGGGTELGAAALWHAARAEDGRGPWTELLPLLLDAVDAPSVGAMIEDVHLGRREGDRLGYLAPLVFRAAADGDVVAQRVVRRQADEVVAYAHACIRRLGLLEVDVPIVFGGGVARARDPLLLSGIEEGISLRIPRAFLTIVDSPPVLGAALLALERVGVDAGALAEVRAELESDERFARPVLL